MPKKDWDFTLDKASDAEWKPGLREIFDYRDLGTKAGTKGEYIAHIIRANGKKMKDEVTRQEFLADVAAFKEQINERAGLTQEELLERYRTKLTERVNIETNDRLRQWYEQQLRTLNTGQPKVVENQVKTFVRYDNVQGLKEIATKYNISNEKLRDHGLQSYGGAYGWR